MADKIKRREKKNREKTIMKPTHVESSAQNTLREKDEPKFLLDVSQRIFIYFSREVKNVPNISIF
jgi:hypothetical protein